MVPHRREGHFPQELNYKPTLYAPSIGKDSKRTTDGPFNIETEPGQDRIQGDRRDQKEGDLRGTHQTSTTMSSKLMKSTHRTSSLGVVSSTILKPRQNQTQTGFQKQEESRIKQENLRLAKKISETKSELNRLVLKKEINKATTYKAQQSQLMKQGKATVQTKLMEKIEKMDYPERFKKRQVEGFRFKKVIKK